MFYVERHGSAAIIYTDRELDLNSRDSFTSVLRDAERGTNEPVVVSLERCSYIDSTALNVLIAAHKRIGNRLSIVIPPQNRCRRIFEICGLQVLLNVTSSVDEALAGAAA